MLEYTVLKQSFECLVAQSVVLPSLFFEVPLNKCLFFYIIVQMHKERFYLCVGGDHSAFQGQIKVILSKSMTDKFINSKSCRNRKLCVCVNLQIK